MKNSLLLTLAITSAAVATDIKPVENVQIGPRPYYLINDMDDGDLKTSLQACANKPLKKSDFSIGHRGAPMQFPEHTKESYVAAAQMGAGIIECDVTFTKDKELVCRHSQCGLHTTTNILETPLAAKCTTPFKAAELDHGGTVMRPAQVKCCTSDITLAEFKTLKGKMDAGNKNATNIKDYMNATAGWRTDLYAANGTLMTFKDSIDLFKKLGVKQTPELKSASVEMPFDGFSQENYAQKLIDELTAANVPASDVFAQSFNLADVKYWINNAPEFGKQAVYLDSKVYNDDNGVENQIKAMPELAKAGVKFIAPPIFTLVKNDNGTIVASDYAKAAKENNIDLITWTLERSGPLANGGGWYYQSIKDVTNNDGDAFTLLDVLAQDVGVKGVFSDWPATTTYYANCKGL